MKGHPCWHFSFSSSSSSGLNSLILATKNFWSLSANFRISRPPMISFQKMREYILWSHIQHSFYPVGCFVMILHWPIPGISSLCPNTLVMIKCLLSWLTFWATCYSILFNFCRYFSFAASSSLSFILRLAFSSAWSSSPGQFFTSSGTLTWT